MRQVARHVWIGELLAGEYVEREGWEPNVVRCGRGEVSRCNLIGAFLSVHGQPLLDDGTGQVSLRAFDEVPGMKDARPGQMVLCVGRPRRYNDQFYVIPEIVRAVDLAWAAVRKAELGAVLPYSPPSTQPPQEPPRPVEGENKAERIISVIAGLDEGEGAPVDDVIAQSGIGPDAERILEQLLLDGEVFEVRPGRVKVL